MSIAGLHAVFIIMLVLCWLTITGRLAEWNWRDWGDSNWRGLFLGWHFDTLSGLKRFHYWLGLLILAVLLFAYTAAMYQWMRG